MMVLICYDGSAEARAAIHGAARLMPGRDATVLVVWETMLESMTRSGSMGMGLGMIGYGDESTDAAIKSAALETAVEGSRLAVDAGLIAEPRIAMREDEIATVILAAASDVGADVIVLGTHGRGGVRSLMLGSVSNAVAHHADRAVLIIPSPALAEERRRTVRHAQLEVTPSDTQPNL